MEETLGKRIVYHRKRLGMTQDRLAEALGVTAQAVSKWENDQSCPDITTLPKLAEIFGITTDALLGVETPRTAEILTEQTRPDEDRDHLWEVHWDAGRKSGIGFALWVLLVGGLAMANAFDCFGGNGPGLWTLCWTCGMLLYGLFGLYPRFRFFRLGCALAGGYFLLNELSIIEIYPQWKYVLPGILILWGISLLFDSLRKPAKGSFHVMHGGKPLVNKCSCEDDRFFCATSFGQNTYSIPLSRLSGGHAEVSFGSMTVDLRECETLTDHCHIDLECSFGQLELRIPKRFRVEMDNDTSFATAEISGTPDEIPQSTLYLKCDASFGRISVLYI